jgi:hypothetical protein
VLTWLNPDHFPAADVERVNNHPAAPPPRLPQQIDFDGGLHDLAPGHESLKLFDSAPQLDGQIALDTDEPEPVDARSVACSKCKAPAGRPCKRPSGHRAMTSHAARVQLARQR